MLNELGNVAEHHLTMGGANLAVSSSLGEIVLDRLLEGKQLLDTRSLHHTLEMCGAMREARQIKFKLPRSPLTPEEVRIRPCEVIEEELSVRQKIVGDREELKQVCRCKLLYALFGARNVTDSRRRVDACQ